MADEAAEFWENFENETGEKVVARSIGELYDRPSGTGTWGLLVVTDKSFRFKYMPSDNWFAVLIRGFGASKKPKEKAPVDIVVRFEEILSVDAPKRGFFAKLFGPAFPRFILTSRGEEGETTRIFTADPSTKILEALRKALPAS